MAKFGELHSAESNLKKRKAALESMESAPPAKVCKAFLARKMEEYIEWLRLSGGNIDVFLSKYVGADEDNREPFLFSLYAELFKSDNEEYRKAWEASLRLHYRMNVDLAKCRAAAKLSKFSNLGTTMAPEISWMKTVLSSELIEGTETSKRKVAKRYGMLAGGPDEGDEDNEESLVDQIDRGLGADE